MFLKTFLRTKSLGWNVRGFTRLLYRLANLRWYDSIHTVAALSSSSAMSRSLVIDLVFGCSNISVQSVGMPIFVGIIASIPLVSAKRDTPAGLGVVVLYAQSSPGSSSTHLILAEYNPFFKAVSRVLLKASAWLLYGYRGVEYKFFIFNSWKKFLYARLSN